VQSRVRPTTHTRWHILALALAAGLGLTAQAQRTATATATVSNGLVVAVTVTDGGAGYTEPPTVPCGAAAARAPRPPARSPTGR
jgi:hypothetical protein